MLGDIGGMRSVGAGGRLDATPDAFASIRAGGGKVVVAPA
jgi:hypothetical protein